MTLKNITEKVDECVIFGLTSMAGAATLFNIMLPNGAVFFRSAYRSVFPKTS